MLKTSINPHMRAILHQCRNWTITNRPASTKSLQKTVLYDFHVEHGGKMVEFAGWSMPVQYKDFGLVASHHHTRQKASLFDVSHMLQVKIHGKDRVKFIESLVVGDIQELKENSGTLSLFTNDSGGIMDDVIINKTDEDLPLYVVSNAGCSEKILQLYSDATSDFKSTTGGDASVELIENGLIALQGPLAAQALQKGVDFDLSKLYFMRGVTGTIFGVKNCRITRCGYTGEDGFELSIPKEHAVTVSEQFLQDENVKLAGLGARDSLRLEAGLCLYGNDIDESTTPVEASLVWCIGKRRRAEKNMRGADIILEQIKQKPDKKRIGLVTDKTTARAGAPVCDSDGNEIGHVTSGCPSPTLQKNIAMAYIPNDVSKIGTKHHVLVRKKLLSSQVVKMPFTPANYYTPPK